MKKSNETKRLEEVRKNVTETLLRWLAEVYEDHAEEGSNVRGDDRGKFERDFNNSK